MRSINRKCIESLFDEGVPESGESTNETKVLTRRDSSDCIPILTFLSGPDMGREIPLLHRHLTLGRGNDCDIIVPDPAVSRRHVRFSTRKAVKKGEDVEFKVLLKDLNSKNGTLVNYLHKTKAVLQPGDKIIVGRVVLQFKHKNQVGQELSAEI